MRWLALALALTACNADIGEPTIQVILQDAGVDASAQDSGLGPDGKKLLGVDCAAPEECESGICFVGGRFSYCSLRCQTDNAKTVCKDAPFDGTCNMQGYCRRP